MHGKVLLASERTPVNANGNSVRWVSLPAVSGSEQIVMIDATVPAGGSHLFHSHPNQEEILMVVSGHIQQWIEREPHDLGPGDAVFVPRGVVHATFNLSDEPAHVIAVASPCVGAEGHEAISVAEQEPWASLGASTLAGVR